MADDQAWAEGWQIGANKAARDQQKKDEEHALKVNTLLQQKDALASKVASLPKDSPEYQEAYGALHGVLGDIADFYHPQKNPGAIQRFGHILTDHVGLTNPQDRAQKQAAQQATRNASIDQSAQRTIAAVPIDPAVHKIRTQMAEIDNSNLSPEDKSEAKRKLFGISEKPLLKPYKMPNGTSVWLDASRPDLIPEGASAIVSETSDTRKRSDYAEFLKKNPDYEKNGGTFEKWTTEQAAAGRGSTSAINQYADAYVKAFGLKSRADMTPEDWDYINRKVAYDKAIPQSTTTTTPKQNENNQWVPITITNTKNPGGAAPAPPRGKPVNNTPPPPPEGVPSANGPTATSAPAPSTPTSPRELKKEAEKRNPRSAKTKETTLPGTTPSGNVRVGQPLFAAPSKEYNDQLSVYDAAVDRTETMDKNLKSAMKGDQQAMLSLVANHIGMTLGAQKGARINQAVWNEAVESTPWLAKVQAKFGPQGYLSGVTLAPEQMKQMVELAHERMDTSKNTLDRIAERINGGVQYPSSRKGSSTQDTSGGLPPGWK